MGFLTHDIQASTAYKVWYTSPLLTNNFLNYSPKFVVYFDSNNDCHDLTFNLGQAAMGATIPSRQFSIKVLENIT